MSSLPSSSSRSFKLPVWAQLAAGAAFLGLVYMVSISSTSYLSAWDEEDSNFYESATQALKISGVNPTAPTALVFWEKESEACLTSIKGLQSAPATLRVYGIHLSEGSDDEVGIRKKWLSLTSRSYRLLIDHTQMLQTSFRVKAVPQVFILLPKQKKIFSYLGDINKSKKRMLEIIGSE